MAHLLAPVASSALVTGASGFIGRSLVRRLAAAGTSVVCVSRHPRTPERRESWVAGDLCDPSFVSNLLGRHRPDVIFHLAGAVTGSRSLEAVIPTLNANLVASVNLLRAATEAGSPRLVLIGSGDQPMNTDLPCAPYAAAKWAMHGYARMFHELFGTPVLTARPFMVYGPDQPDTTKIVPYVITTLLRNERPLLSSGHRRCDWVFVEDVVDGLLMLATAPGPFGQLLDLGTGSLRSVREIVDAIVRTIESSVTPAWGARADRPGETEYVADAELTRARCGWVAATSLEDGVVRTVEWYRRHQR